MPKDCACYRHLRFRVPRSQLLPVQVLLRPELAGRASLWACPGGLDRLLLQRRGSKATGQARHDPHERRVLDQRIRAGLTSARYHLCVGDLHDACRGLGVPRRDQHEASKLGRGNPNAL